jgi:hypothetical protein
MNDPIQYIHHLFVIKTRSPALIEAQKRYYEKNKGNQMKRNHERYRTDEEFRLKQIGYVRQSQLRKKNADGV